MTIRAIISRTRAAALALLLLPATGCALLNGFLNPTNVGMFPLDFREGGIRRVLSPREGPTGIAGATEPTPDDLKPSYDEYRIGEADTIGLLIEDFLQPGFPYQAALEVSPTGFVSVPQLGLVKTAGLTENELRQDLVDRIRAAGLLPDPIVQVFVTVRRSQYFTIVGSVQQAGSYPLPQRDFRLLDAIGVARDIGAEAARLYVIRRSAAAPTAAQPSAAAPTTPAPESRPTTPAATPADDLVIPPPDDGGTFSVRLGTNGGADSAEDPPPAAPNPAMPQIDKPFRPLVFDPASGELRETSLERAPAGVPAGSDFDWEKVPDFELSQRVIQIDVRALRAGDPKQNVVIRSQDTIFVPIDTGLFYVMGEVNRPGPYNFNGRDITIKQAVSLVGGFSQLAWPQRCEIVRREPGTDKQVTIPVNVDAIFAGLEDDVLLRDDDILNVGTHVAAPFLFVIRNSFRFTYGFGFVYDRNFADQDAFQPRVNPETRDDIRRQQRGLSF